MPVRPLLRRKERSESYAGTDGEGPVSPVPFRALLRHRCRHPARRFPAAMSHDAPTILLHRDTHCQVFRRRCSKSARLCGNGSSSKAKCYRTLFQQALYQKCVFQTDLGLRDRSDSAREGVSVQRLGSIRVRPRRGWQTEKKDRSCSSAEKSSSRVGVSANRPASRSTIAPLNVARWPSKALRVRLDR